MDIRHIFLILNYFTGHSTISFLSTEYFTVQSELSGGVMIEDQIPNQPVFEE